MKGLVQGVFFRASARDEAVRIGLTGKVRNTGDGHVEIWASGTDEQLCEFVGWCRKGPSRAKVTEVQTESVEGESYKGFEVIRS